MNDQTRPGIIVVGVGGSPTAEAALQWAIREAARTHQRLHAVTVRRSDEPEDKRLAQHVSDVGHDHPGVPLRHRVLRGPVGQALVEESETAAMLVVGSHGMSRVLSALLGSVSAYCVRHARCPVVVVPAVMAGTAPAALTPGPLL
ncbi:universal stress protein [Actinokineospora sp. PR83]|uniref:universal stress protein n=1 Tax=Actinokineospora sp. PR83 TaxID=2884908 RepID=UPI0027E0D63B|nr:universal stress protein [Actinokineospora sp. PR83]MCG8917490.1 universal stress protein [Actinokineospora sp. PR83]